jgi:hypothetical protein
VLGLFSEPLRFGLQRVALPGHGDQFALPGLGGLAQLENPVFMKPQMLLFICSQLRH